GAGGEGGVLLVEGELAGDEEGVAGRGFALLGGFEKVVEDELGLDVGGEGGLADGGLEVRRVGGAAAAVGSGVVDGADDIHLGEPGGVAGGYVAGGFAAEEHDPEAVGYFDDATAEAVVGFLVAAEGEKDF